MIKILTLKILLFPLYYTNLCSFYFTLDFIEPEFLCRVIILINKNKLISIPKKDYLLYNYSGE